MIFFRGIRRAYARRKVWKQVREVEAAIDQEPSPSVRIAMYRDLFELHNRLTALM